MTLEENGTTDPAPEVAAPAREEPVPGPGGGSVRFEVRHRIDPDEWQAIADASPAATFFHTPAWFSVFTRSDPAARIATKVFRFEDGQTAVFPMLARRRLGGLLVKTESGPAVCYGGWISADPLTPDHARAIARWVQRASGDLLWRVNPFDPLASVLDPFATIQDSTEVESILRSISLETRIHCEQQLPLVHSPVFLNPQSPGIGISEVH